MTEVYERVGVSPVEVYEKVKRLKRGKRENVPVLRQCLYSSAKVCKVVN